MRRSISSNSSCGRGDSDYDNSDEDEGDSTVEDDPDRKDASDMDDSESELLPVPGNAPDNPWREHLDRCAESFRLLSAGDELQIVTVL